MDRLILKIRLLLLSLLRLRSSSPSSSGPVSLIKRFSYKDIKRATDGFRRMIDDPTHGPAYKAKFRDGRVALVREVRAFSEEQDAFYREVQHLGRLHHRHVVALCGYSSGSKRFLVYENSENGSLKEHLNDPLKTPLNWRTRLQIAIGVAAALEYLHFFCDPPIYHVSINSSTVMLDENFIAKLSDVGILSSGGGNLGALQNSSCSKDYKDRVCGNVAFQLGLLILELITGQSSEEGGDILQWVKEAHFSESIHKMIDPDLGNSYDNKELSSLLAVARLCLKSADKPTTSFIPQIFRFLQKKVSIPQHLHR